MDSEDGTDFTQPFQVASAADPSTLMRLNPEDPNRTIDALRGGHHGESSECVASVKALHGLPPTPQWSPIGPVGSDTQIGAPIAIFDQSGRYTNTYGKSHAATYLGISPDGHMVVGEQSNGIPWHTSLVPFSGQGGERDALSYSVIGTKGGPRVTQAAAPSIDDFLTSVGKNEAPATQRAGESVDDFLTSVGKTAAPTQPSAPASPAAPTPAPTVGAMAGKSTPNPRTSPVPSPAAGVSQGLGDAVTGGAQLLTHLLPASVVAAGNQANNWLADKTGLVAPIPAGGMDQVAQQREADYQAGRTARGETGFDMPRAFGNMLDPVNSAPQAVLGRAVTGIGRIAQAGMSGAVAGGLNPVTDAPADFWAEKAKQAGVGAVGGATLGAGAEGVARVISPTLRPSANLLAGEGVQLTPGQMAGGFGKTLEDMGTSIPLLGSMIQGGQRKSLESFNRVAINKALEPIGETLPASTQVGHGAVDYAATKLGDAYDALLPKLSGSLSPSFQADIAGVRNLGSKLPPAQAGQLDRIIQNEVIDRFQGGTAPGDVIKQIESKLGQIGSTMGRSEDYDVRNLGQGVQELQGSLRRMIQDQNPQYANELGAINSGWANLIRIQKAAGSAGARDGVFTPAQLINAVKSSDPTKNKAGYARGNALMQDFAGAARDVLPSTVPDSGTAGRLMMANMLTAAGAGHFLNEPMIPAGAAIGGVLAALPYSAPGMNLLNRYATAAPQTRNLLAGGIRLATPQLAGGAGASTR